MPFLRGLSVGSGNTENYASFNLLTSLVDSIKNVTLQATLDYSLSNASKLLEIDYDILVYDDEACFDALNYSFVAGTTQIGGNGVW
jgi:hypothetical protein